MHCEAVYAPVLDVFALRAQLEQLGEPLASPYVPNAHAVHISGDVAAVCSLKRPTGHSSHVTIPVVGL